MHRSIERLKSCWPDNDPVHIACHGHSVPAGYFCTPEVRTFDSYPQLLLWELKSRFPCAIINTIVTAKGGEASNAGAARFAQDVVCHRPCLVTIDYALNDRRIGLDLARRSWIAMIESARASGADVILLTPTPDLHESPNGFGESLRQHARQVRELAAKYQTGLADASAAFEKWIASGGRLEQVMAQHNHPNRKGHDLVVAELLRCLGEWM
jgi:acyl-CoA thioesterase I